MKKMNKGTKLGILAGVVAAVAGLVTWAGGKALKMDAEDSVTFKAEFTAETTGDADANSESSETNEATEQNQSDAQEGM